MIEANTFGANRRKLAEHYLEDDVVAINEAAVKIARDAPGGLGPAFSSPARSGRSVLPATPGEDDASVFEEQALLEGRGVDLFMVETFYDLDEPGPRSPLFAPCPRCPSSPC